MAPELILQKKTKQTKTKPHTFFTHSAGWCSAAAADESSHCQTKSHWMSADMPQTLTNKTLQKNQRIRSLGYDVWMKSLTDVRRCVLSLMVWSNLIWCLLCVLWGTRWNSLSTDESFTSMDREGKTWCSIWAEKQCMALICTPPRGDVLSPVSSSAGNRWKYLLDGKRNV